MFSFNNSSKITLTPYVSSSLILHGILILGLWLFNIFDFLKTKHNVNNQINILPKENIKPVEAVMINENLVKIEVKKLIDEKEAQQKIALQKLAEIQKATEALQQQKSAEEIALQDIQNKKITELNKKNLEQQNLLALQKQQKITEDLLAKQKQELSELQKKQQVQQATQELLAKQKSNLRKELTKDIKKDIKKDLKNDLKKKPVELKAQKIQAQKIQQEKLLAKFRENLSAEQKNMLQKQLQNEMESIQAQQQAEKNAIDSAINQFELLILDTIRRSWHSQPQFYGKNLSAIVEIQFAPTGDVLATDLFKQSGDTALDLSIQNAIHKIKHVTVPDDPKIFNLIRTVRVTFRPDENNLDKFSG